MIFWALLEKFNDLVMVKINHREFLISKFKVT